MEVILYLFLANFGWLEFETYETFDICNTAKAHIIEGYMGNSKLEGLCCALDELGCNTQEQLAELAEGSK
jgi:hypothetical protein|tara:strand:- start:590 stop:799 length:210 start_codon:yes stop_codon:yes gene_type:complete